MPLDVLLLGMQYSLVECTHTIINDYCSESADKALASLPTLSARLMETFMATSDQLIADSVKAFNVCMVLYV